MSVRKNVVANFLGQGWAGLMGLAFLPLYIKYLGMEAYGLIGFYAVMQAWLALLDMGMTPTLNREMARYTAGAHTPCSIGNLLRSLETICVGVALIIGFAVWAASGWIAADWLQAKQIPVATIAQAVTIMAWVLALRLVEGLYRGALLGLQKQVWLNAVNAVVATARWAGAVAVLAWFSPSIEVFFIWQGFVSALSALFLGVSLHRSLPYCERPLRFCKEAMLGISHFAGGMIATTLLAILLTQVDKMLLSRLLNLDAFGHYTLAATVAGALLMLVIPIEQAFYPRLTELATHQDKDSLAKTYHRGAQLVSVVLIPVALLMAFFGEQLLSLWTGDVDLAKEIAPLLRLLAIGTMLNGLMHIPYMLQLAHGWSSFAARVNLFAVSILVPAIVWVTPHYGAIGAGWCWVTLNIGYVLISIHFMHRKLLTNEKWKWYVDDIAKPALMAGSCIFLSHSCFPLGLGRTGILIWLIGTFLLTGFFTLISYKSKNLISNFKS